MKLFVLLFVNLFTLSMFSQTSNTNDLINNLHSAADVLKYYQNPRNVTDFDSSYVNVISNQNYQTIKNKYQHKGFIGSLDSIVDFSDSIIQYRDIYKYDSYGNLISEKRFERDSSSIPWHPSGYNSMTYNSNQNITSKIAAQWDYTNNCWINYAKAELLYDSTKRRTAQLNYMWNSNTATWILGTRSVYTYLNDSIVNKINYDTYNANGQWEHYNRDVYFFDSLVLLKQYKFSIFINSNWELRFKSCYKYDSNNNNVETNILDYNTQTTVLDSTHKFIHTFNSANQIVQQDIYWRDTTNATNWRTINRYTYDYDVSGRKIEEILYPYSSTYGYVMLSKMTATYDTFGNRSTFSEFERGSTQVLDTVFIMEYSYNYNFNNSDLALPYILDIGNMLTRIKYNAWSTSNPNNPRRGDLTSVYYYSNTIGFNENKQLSNSCKAYPNPTSDYLIFEIEDSKIQLIELFDISGKRVLTFNQKNNNRFYVGNLQKGLYFYKILTRNREYAGKVIIQ